jgi:hypothetical protein
VRHKVNEMTHIQDGSKREGFCCTPYPINTQIYTYDISQVEICPF